MSLEELELRKRLEPILKELDRQKEKAAFWKKKVQTITEMISGLYKLDSREEILADLDEVVDVLQKPQHERKKKGLEALLGQWSGDETIEDLTDQLKKSKGIK